MPTHRFIAALLIALQAWVAVMGGGGKSGCVRMWSCVPATEAAMDVASDDAPCACCRKAHQEQAPAKSELRQHPECCVDLPLITGASQRSLSASHDELAVCTHLHVQVARIVTPVSDPLHAPRAWPPPDPVGRWAASGLRTTRLLI